MAKHKVEYYVELALHLANNRSYDTGIEYMMKPKRLDYLLDAKRKTERNNKSIWDETVSVWKEAYTILNARPKSDDVDMALKIIKSRIDYIQGKFTDANLNGYKKIYMDNYKAYKEYFSNETLEYALSQIPLSDLVRKEDVYNSFDYYADRGYLVIGDCQKKVFVKNRYSGGHYETIYGRKMLLPNPHQSPICSKFTKLCALKEYPYLSKYNAEFFGLDYGVHEFYVKIEEGDFKGTAYIPFECLTKHSIEPALNRMNTYFRDYYGEKAPKVLKVMDTQVFKNLKNDIERG